MKKIQTTPNNGWKRWFGLFITSLALAIIIIDTTVLNVSLKNIREDLGASLQTMDWIITSYSLILAALTITGGRLGDLFGRKKMFMLGAFLFGLGSLISSFSTSTTMLWFGWSFMEGVGAALMMPATASMVVTNFQGKDRAIAFGVWGSIAGVSSALGPLLGGYLTTNYSWHWAFRINVAIVAIVLIGSVVLKETIDKKEAHTLDIVGSILSALTMVGIVYGISESSNYGWWSAKKAWEIFGKTIEFGGLSITPIAITIGLIFGALFVLWELRMQKLGKTPLVSLSIFQNKQFLVGVLVTMVMSLGQAGIIFSIPVFLQAVRELPAFEIGKALIPMSISILFVAPLSAILRKKIAIRDLIQAGIIINAIGVYLIYRTLSVDATAASLAPGLFVMGIGMGLVSSLISNVTLSAVDVNMAGEASGVNSTLRNLGSSLGSALIGAVFLAAINTGMTDGITASQLIPEQAKPAIIQAVNNTNGQTGESAIPKEATQGIPPQFAVKLIEEFKTITQQSFVSGSKSALALTLGFSGLTVLSTLLLPRHIQEVEKDQKLASAH